MHYSTSSKLINSTKNFLQLKKSSFLQRSYPKGSLFYGWGRKASGRRAVALAKKHQGDYRLLEDGFIRSLGLGVEGSESFSMVEDDCGIYYDASTPSRLEAILNGYDFASHPTLLDRAYQAMALMREHHIAKYNHASDLPYGYFKEDNQKKILIILQTDQDHSLKYGKGEKYTTKKMLNDAIEENPNASIYLKLHPDVLAGKRKSTLAMSDIPQGVTLIQEDYHPISLLKGFDRVYTQTSGMGMEALIVGCQVVCYGVPFYAGWGLTEDRQECARRKRTLRLEELFAGAYILYSRYYNPFSQQPSTIIDTIETLARYKKQQAEDRGRCFLFGFSWWKRATLRQFFSPNSELFFCSTLHQAKQKGLYKGDKLYIWGKKPFDEVERYAKEQGNPLYRIEDGFIRSHSLGSDLTKGYSIVVDSRGIYFDPSSPSDLEYLLEETDYSLELLNRAEDLKKSIIAQRISKYNILLETKVILEGYQEGQRVLLVVGQVGDDASVIDGGEGMSNLKLLQMVRERAKESYIIYKPHPDVVAGNRQGALSYKQMHAYANSVLAHTSVDSILQVCDEVHTITSLVGFEALMRGKRVYTYGVPFYAGWGLTDDRVTITRRTKRLELNALIAGTLILYPRYLDPLTGKRCEVEVLLDRLQSQREKYQTHRLYRLAINFRHAIVRGVQRVGRRYKDIEI
jgi:capsular polysaccharide export protein